MKNDPIYKRAIRQNIGQIYEQVDGLLRASSFKEVDQLLEEITEDFEHYSPEEILTYLTGTLPAKELLQKRTALACTARATWEVERPKEVDGLLMGLE